MSTLLRIGQLASKTGKTRRTLHFYEELGLLSPASRTEGGFRQYDPASVQRVQWIVRLQELGFSLPDVQRFLVDLKAHDQGPQAMEALRSFYQSKHRETIEQIGRLRGLARELEHSLAYLTECQSCAPATPRRACATCGEHSIDEPDLVAAVTAAS